MVKACPICGGSKIEWIKLNYTLLKHLGFVDFQSHGTMGRCLTCQLLISGMTTSQEKKQLKMGGSLDYAEAPITNQTFLLDNGQRVTRFFLQAELLKRFLKNSKDTRVLDIGCFHGEFLLELHDRFPKAKFHGFDTNKHLKNHFPAKKNFTLHLSGLSEVKGEFDLICLSMSMIYIKTIDGLFKNIRRLLKKDGRVFIQLVDLDKNPYSILLGDQYYHFTPTILRNVLGQRGFELDLVHDAHFPRDIIGIARLSRSKESQPVKEDVSVHRTVEFLDKAKKKLLTISKEADLCVLGTTTIAAFVDIVLGQRIQFFVDENISGFEGDTRFRGKRVISPVSLNKSVHLILPYGLANESIRKRFERDYHLTNFELT